MPCFSVLSCDTLQGAGPLFNRSWPASVREDDILLVRACQDLLLKVWETYPQNDYSPTFLLVLGSHSEFQPPK